MNSIIRDVVGVAFFAVVIACHEKSPEGEKTRRPSRRRRRAPLPPRRALQRVGSGAYFGELPAYELVLRRVFFRTPSSILMSY
jgi:hypothetical protein